MRSQYIVWPYERCSYLTQLASQRVVDGCQLQGGPQEAQLSPRDRAMHRLNSNLANCHATVQKLLIRQVLTKSMV